MKAALAVIGALIAVAVIAAVGYQANWWLREQEVNRSAQIDRGSFEYQETRRDEIVRQAETLTDLDVQITSPDITAEQRSALQAQRNSARDQMCNIAADLIGEQTPTVSQIINQECDPS